MTTLLTGQIPNFTEPGKDGYFKLDLSYAATIQKQDATGTTIAFSVEDEQLGLLEKEPGPDGKVVGEVLPFPIPLAQAQSFLNVTAVLRPDGSIASVTGGSNDPIKIDIGFDLRKLFVLLLPIVFPDHPVQQGDVWPFEEGLLGRKPGVTTYTGKLAGIHPDSKKIAFEVTQKAQSVIDDKIDKEGNSTSKPEAQVGTLTGTVTATSTMDFQTAKPDKPSVGAKDVSYGGRLVTGRLDMRVDLKRVLPDEDHPDMKKTVPITVHARMFVQMTSGLPKQPTDGQKTSSETTPGTSGAGANTVKDTKK